MAKGLTGDGWWQKSWKGCAVQAERIRNCRGWAGGHKWASIPPPPAIEFRWIAPWPRIREPSTREVVMAILISTTDRVGRGERIGMRQDEKAGGWELRCGLLGCCMRAICGRIARVDGWRGRLGRLGHFHRCKNPSRAKAKEVGVVNRKGGFRKGLWFQKYRQKSPRPKKSLIAVHGPTACTPKSKIPQILKYLLSHQYDSYWWSS